MGVHQGGLTRLQTETSLQVLSSLGNPFLTCHPSSGAALPRGYQGGLLAAYTSSPELPFPSASTKDRELKGLEEWSLVSSAPVSSLNKTLGTLGGQL